MNQDLFDRIKHDFPLTFKNKIWSGQNTGIGDGWEPILRELCSNIEDILFKNKDIEFSIFQIKEKLSSLRFYFSCSNKNIYNQIDTLALEAENKSGIICEHCGKYGKQCSSNYGWIKIYCNDCAKEKDFSFKEKF